VRGKKEEKGGVPGPPDHMVKGKERGCAAETNGGVPSFVRRARSPRFKKKEERGSHEGERGKYSFRFLKLAPPGRENPG